MRQASALILSGGSKVPTVPGTPFQGGYYVGRFKDDQGISWALILEPLAESNRILTKQWKTTNTRTPGTFSNWDGAANTALMMANDPNLHPAAGTCAYLTKGGFNDWFLPARDQLEMCYRAFKIKTIANYALYDNGLNNRSDPPMPAYTESNPAQTSLADFQAGGPQAFADAVYWTSTQNADDSAWWDRFDTGQQSASSKVTAYYWRAVRQVRI